MREINMSEIEIMTHEQAMNTGAVERYLLGELTEEQRSAFEAHYFDCKVCFDQIELSQDFMRQARQVLGEDQPGRAKIDSEKITQKSSSTALPSPGWLAGVLGDLRRPAMAFVSAMLLCAIGIGVYQHNQISSLKAPRVEARYTLVGEAKGGPEKQISVARNTMLGLRVDFLRRAEFVSYRAQIVSEAGKVKYSLPIPNQTEDSVTVSLPADDLEAGKYSLVVHGVTADGTQTETGHGGFDLQFTN